ncbi:unnamed protein product [Nezara viridula]|uniref:Cysteine sulfinic acid decarboxylase n=1 Tax=Nezara viridula TaxID=85310 RepID=A0A9P0EAW5_NEZVI|nr:unnamed protein product [Nezara viridula]
MESLKRVVAILEEEGVVEPVGPLLLFRQPQQLQAELDLSLGDAAKEDELWDCLKKITRHSVKTRHPGFLNQLYGGLDEYGLAGELLASALNTNQYTYEVAPSLTLCEMEVIKRALSLVGFNNGDGIFTPGGSISNMYGLVLARYKKYPEIKEKGIAGMPPFVIYTSQDAHYSMTKGSHWLGIGTDNVIKVKTDQRGRMLPSALEEAIELTLAQGKVPMAVNSTAGTTVLGAFDNFQEIADVCEKYGIWMHIDGCWGGSVVFSKKHSRLLKGIERADSFSWNPHKMLGAPLQCSMILVKEKGLLNAANRAGATYLFQQDKMYDVSFDSGDKSVQCGRKTDALKLWTLWKARGDSGLARAVDDTMHLSRYFLEKIRDRIGFKLVLEEFQCTNICFWYIPMRLRNKTEDQAWWEQVHAVAPKLKEKMVLDGCLMIGYQPLDHKNLRNFFRLVITCRPERDEAFIDSVIENIDRLGRDL